MLSALIVQPFLGCANPLGSPEIGGNGFNAETDGPIFSGEGGNEWAVLLAQVQ